MPAKLPRQLPTKKAGLLPKGMLPPRGHGGPEEAMRMSTQPLQARKPDSTQYTKLRNSKAKVIVRKKTDFCTKGHQLGLQANRPGTCPGL